MNGPKLSYEEVLERYGRSVVPPEQAGAEVYPYVWVTSEGGVHELSQEDRSYLEQRFHPCDSARPWTKSTFRSKDGRESMEGFCPRSKLPPGTVVDSSPVVRDDRPMIDLIREEAEKEGQEFIANPDGSFTVRAPKKKAWWRFW